MVVMGLLRIFADLGFYYAIAGTVSSFAGGRCQFPSVVLLGGCYAACALLRKRKQRQVLVLAAAALALLLPVPRADRVFYVPALGYVLHLVRQDDFHPDRARQAELFETFGRVFVLFSFFWCLALFIFNPEERIPVLFQTAIRDWLAAGVPMAVFAALSAVLLLRSIRHEPAVYLRPGFQAANVAAIAGVLLLAFCISSPWGIRAMIWTYQHVLAPLLLACFMLVGMFLVLLYPLLQLIVAFFLREDIAAVFAEIRAKFGEFMRLVLELAGLPAAQILSGALWALGILTAAWLTVHLLRLLLLWLSYFVKLVLERGREGSAGVGVRSDILPVLPDVRRREARDRNDVERVRRQYRVFLRLCRRYGVSFRRASTSGEISEEAVRVFGPEAPAGDIRDIYREARYRGEASRADAVRLKKLCDRVKKLHPRKR